MSRSIHWRKFVRAHETGVDAIEKSSEAERAVEAKCAGAGVECICTWTIKLSKT